MLLATVTLSAPLDTSDGWLFNLVTIAINGEKPFTNPAITGGIPSMSLVILPTPGNTTGNYLWTGASSAGAQAYLWLQIAQSGTVASGSAE